MMCAYSAQLLQRGQNSTMTGYLLRWRSETREIQSGSEEPYRRCQYRIDAVQMHWPTIRLSIAILATAFYALRAYLPSAINLIEVLPQHIITPRIKT
jgi:hypothetical protein